VRDLCLSGPEFAERLSDGHTLDASAQQFAADIQTMNGCVGSEHSLKLIGSGLQFEDMSAFDRHLIGGHEE
jgi:hypothetical protein